MLGKHIKQGKERQWRALQAQDQIKDLNPTKRSVGRPEGSKKKRQYTYGYNLIYVSNAVS